MMETRPQLEAWSKQASAAGKDARADFDVALRLLKHGTEALDEIERLRKIEAAANNLVAQKGRHHTQQAYEQLAALLVPNA